MSEQDNYEEEFDDQPNDADIKAYVRGQPLDKEIVDLIEDIVAQSPSFRCWVLEAKIEWLEERLQELQEEDQLPRTPKELRCPKCGKHKLDVRDKPIYDLKTKTMHFVVMCNACQWEAWASKPLCLTQKEVDTLAES